MEENKNENKNKKLKILVIVVGLVLLVGVGITIAYFMSRASGDPTTVTAANLSITYTNEQTFNLEDMNPLYENEVKTKAPRIEFTVTNTGATKTYLEIDLVDITLDKLKDYDFKWALYEGETKITTGTFMAEEDKQIVLASGLELAGGNANKKYSVYVWIDETGLDQTELMGESFTGTVSVLGLGQNNTLASKLSTTTAKDNPTFSTSSTDKGLYVQKGDSEKSNFGFPTYYYRGAVTNNYVQFGTYKSNVTNKVYVESSNQDQQVAKNGEAILWRIVRINEDGSIRLIAEHNIGDEYHIWDLNAVPNYDESDIKDTVDTWYGATFTESTLQKKIQTSSYCNDITDYYEAVKKRIETNDLPTPIFTCPVGSIIANEKAGLITADEMVYGGALTSSVSGNTTYLDNRTHFWTISPYSSSDVLEWNPTFYLSGRYPNYGGDETLAAARPVINLKSNVTVLSGSGTSDDPYVIG